MVLPADAQYQRLWLVKVPKYCSKTIFPSFKIINPLVFSCSRKVYRLFILSGHHSSVAGSVVSQVAVELIGGKYSG
jgi:hypothetical protein